MLEGVLVLPGPTSHNPDMSPKPLADHHPASVWTSPA